MNISNSIIKKKVKRSIFLKLLRDKSWKKATQIWSFKSIVQQLFSFTGKKVATSIVVGPKEIQSSEVNRKVNIDPKELLLKLINN
jgi:hypothetical protein